MEIIDSRTSTGTKVDEPEVARFRPTLDGFQVYGDVTLVRLIEVEEDSIIARASAFAEPSLHGVVLQSVRFPAGAVVRFLKDVGTKIEFLDTDADCLLIDSHDVVGWWKNETAPSA